MNYMKKVKSLKIGECGELLKKGETLKIGENVGKEENVKIC